MPILWRKQAGIWDKPKAMLQKQGGTWPNQVLWHKNAGVWSPFTAPSGDWISTGDITHDEIVSLLDGDMVRLNVLGNMHIQAGHRVRPTVRCKGLIIDVAGDLLVDGTLTMSGRGAHAQGRFVGINYVNRTVSVSPDKITNPFVGLSDTVIIEPDGGLGGSGLNVSTNVIGPLDTGKGANGINGACGGGGGSYGSTGGAGTSFSGGAGAGGAVARSTSLVPNSSSPPGAGAANGGPGGNGRDFTSGAADKPYGGGGGAGNPGGTCPSSISDRPGYSGTGGLLIVFVGGNIIVSDTGAIRSRGSAGGAGDTQSGRRPSYGGAGSGGGAIHIFYKGTFTGIDKVDANGGLRGLQDTSLSERTKYASDGGDGTVNIMQV